MIDLSLYAEIANAIKVDNSEHEYKDCSVTNATIMECKNAAEKFSFKPKFEATQDSLAIYGVKSDYDKFSDIVSGKSKDAPISVPQNGNIDDLFDAFLADYGHKEVTDEEAEKVADMLDIDDFDPSIESHAEWLQKIMDKVKEKEDKKIDSSIKSQKKSTNVKIPDEEVPKIDDKTYELAKNVVSEMKKNKKLQEKIHDVNIPANYARNAIAAFAKHYVKDVSSQKDVIDILQKDYDASHGDLTQLFDIY